MVRKAGQENAGDESGNTVGDQEMDINTSRVFGYLVREICVKCQEHGRS